MAAQISHVLAGEAALRSALPEEAETVLDAAGPAFRLGCQGPDIFYHNQRSKPSGLHYGARKELVLEAINGLGIPSALEHPFPGDPAFAERVSGWQAEHGVSHEHATLHEVLAELHGAEDGLVRHEVHLRAVGLA